MADIVNVYVVDYWDQAGAFTAYLPSSSAGSLVDDLVVFLEGVCDTGITSADQVINRFADLTPEPVSTAFAHIYDACVLEFAVDGEPNYRFLFLGPKVACFNLDGTIDESFGPLADLIAWMLENATNHEGDPLASLISGWHDQVTPGWVSVLSAAAYVARGGMVADFWTQDGADVTVRDE